jgi:hypothetical protein
MLDAPDHQAVRAEVSQLSLNFAPRETIAGSGGAVCSAADLSTAQSVFEVFEVIGHTMP